MTREQLIEQGYVSLTEPYIMPKEDVIFSRAVKQLNRHGGDIHYLLWSEERDTVEIWTIPSKPSIPE